MWFEQRKKICEDKLLHGILKMVHEDTRPRRADQQRPPVPEEG